MVTVLCNTSIEWYIAYAVLKPSVLPGGSCAHCSVWCNPRIRSVQHRQAPEGILFSVCSTIW